MRNNINKNPWFDYPEFNWHNKHAIIIGGGIAGCQMAWHLCQNGWQVTLIERHTKLATEASGNPVGVISPKMTSQESLGESFYSECFEYTLSLLETLKQQGKEVNWENCGMLQISHNAREIKRWEALKQRDLSSEFIQLLNEKQTSQQADIELPYKSSYFPQAGWIKPVSFCQALADHPNCKIIYESEALDLINEQQMWQVNNANNKTLAQAEVIIISSGKDLRSFKQSTFLPCMPVAGQTTSALTGKTSKSLKAVIGHEGYLTPAIDDQHIFGATFERNQSTATLKQDSDNENLQQLNKYLPEFTHSLSQFKSAHAAIRMTTPDRFPYVGALPDKNFYQKNYHDLHEGKQWKTYPQAKYQSGLFILGGLGSRGLTTSGLCANMLVNIIENKHLSTSNNQWLSYCHPARFLVRALKRNLK